MINAGCFRLAGFDRDSDKAPTWLPNDSFEDLGDAVEAATTRIDTGLSARVDVLQLDGRTGYVVRAVTSDGVETVDQVRRDLGGGVENTLSAAARSVVLVGLATIRRSLATTTIVSAMTAKDATRSLESTFGTMLWTDGVTSRPNVRIFEYGSAQIESFRGISAFIGVNCRGSFECANGASTIRLTFRPTRGAIVTGAMYFALTLLCTLAATFPARSGVSPNRWLYSGTLLFGAGGWWILKIVSKHRRQTDVAFLDALDGAGSKPGRGRKDRRKKAL